MVKAGAKPQGFPTSESTTSNLPMEPSDIPLESQEAGATEESTNVDIQLLDHLQFLGESAGENISENVGILTDNGVQKRLEQLM